MRFRLANCKIYGSTNEPPRADEVKMAWEKVADIIIGSSPRCFESRIPVWEAVYDIRQRAKQKLAGNRHQTLATSGGESTIEILTLAEDVAASQCLL